MEPRDRAQPPAAPRTGATAPLPQAGATAPLLLTGNRAPLLQTGNLVPLPLSETLAALPPEWPDSGLPEAIRAESRTARLVVLDDDPTGAQTMYGIPVVTCWDVPTLTGALSHPWPAVYVLTNSRSLTGEAAARVATEAATALAEAASLAGVNLRVLSRSDSTLRGHFPAETDALAAGLARAGIATDRLLLTPAFMEGGRLTLGGVHYVREGERLIPAHETEYARDAVFGFRTAYLPDWVAEKTGGRIPADRVTVLPLAEIRQGGPDAVARRLAAVPPGGVAAVDALTYRDLEVVALALLRAEALGVRYLCRTAASFVRALAGLTERPLLTPAEVADPSARTGGLCVVGSYIKKSTDQLAHLLDLPDVLGVELRVPEVLTEAGAAREVARVAASVQDGLTAGLDVVVHTSRALITGATAAESLAIGRAVSTALTEAVGRVRVRPRFLIAKGGITSHDVAVRSLGVRMAQVKGQLIPGVPVWELGAETPFPGLAYVVFPGNVGGPDDLARVFTALRGPRFEKHLS